LKTRWRSQKGQAVVELAFQIPLMLALMFGAVEIGKIFYTYHGLQKALRGGAGILARSVNTNYCDISDTTISDAKNFMVYGNIQGEGSPILPGFTTDMIQVLPERGIAGTTGVTACLCAEDVDSCDASTGGRSPDFVVVNLGDGYPLAIPFPYYDIGSVNLRVSVRMPVTGR
jgi:hypothetical protein